MEKNYTVDSVMSKDGTKIGYRKIGKGPGIVVLHGTVESAASHMQLGEALSDSFTVYLVDRRGRGMSDPHGDDYSMQKEIEDLDAILKKTGAQNVFGVSSGAIITLNAALVLPAIKKAGIFEPPFVVGDSFSTDFVSRYEEEIARKDYVSALVTAMLGAQMGPPIFNSMPRWLLKMMTRAMASGEAKKAKEGDVTMMTLAPTIHYDFQLVLASKGSLARFKAIKSDVILLGGSQSPQYLKIALEALEKVFPKAKHTVFPGAAHGASGNRDRGGKPDLVAKTLKEFFS